MSVSRAVRNPRAFVGVKWNRLKVLLVDPGRFFEEKPETDRLWNEVVALFFVGLPGTAGMYYVAQKIMEEFYTGSPFDPGDRLRISQEAAARIWGFSARAVIGIFVLWILLALGYYAVSWLYSEHGSLFRLFKYSAWSLVPLFFGNLVRAVGLVWAAMNTEIEVGSADMNQTHQALREFLYLQVLEHPAVLVTMGISVLFIAYSGYIAAHAVAEVRDIPVSDAYKAAAVPTLVYIAFVVQDLLNYAGV